MIVLSDFFYFFVSLGVISDGFIKFNSCFFLVEIFKLLLVCFINFDLISFLMILVCVVGVFKLCFFIFFNNVFLVNGFGGDVNFLLMVKFGVMVMFFCYWIVDSGCLVVVF